MVENGSGRVARSRAEWAAIVEGQERSRRSAARFCREQGIVYKNFLYRRKTIRKGGGQLAAVGLSPRISGRFMPIRVEDGASVRLRFPTGLVLESDRFPSAAWVVEVARRWAVREDSPC